MTRPILATCSLCGRGKFTDDGLPCSVCVTGKTQGWTTGDEFAFLRARCDGGRIIAGAFVTSGDFLRGYLAGARLRTAWDDLDRDLVLRFVEGELEKRRAA